jgi:hypothetical protein
MLAASRDEDRAPHLDRVLHAGPVGCRTINSRSITTSRPGSEEVDATILRFPAG